MNPYKGRKEYVSAIILIKLVLVVTFITVMAHGTYSRIE
jgi:hypothetical protein